MSTDNERPIVKVSSEPPTFKTEASLWKMLVDGRKTWEARFYDISDDRVYRLSWAHWETYAGNRFTAAPPHQDSGVKPYRTWDEPFIRFLNKETDQIAEFRYAGMEFVPWAPGWVFFQLGGRTRIIEPDGSISQEIKDGSSLPRARKIDQLQAILNSQEEDRENWPKLEPLQASQTIGGDETLHLSLHEQEVCFVFDPSGEKLLGLSNWKK